MRRDHIIYDLPSSYQRLEYIEGTGGQYINTHLPAPNGFICECGFNFSQSQRNYQPYIVGSHNLQNPYGRNGIGHKRGYFFMGLGDQYPASNTPVVYERKYNIKASTIKGNSYMYVNDSQLITNDNTTERSSNPILVMASQWTLSDPEFGSYCTAGKLYWLHLTIGGNDYVFLPVIRVEDAKPGLYETENNVFYMNAGTGEFLYA